MYNTAKKIKIKSIKGIISRYVAEILLNLDESFLKKAEIWINAAIEQDRKNGTTFQLGNDYVIYSRLFKEKRDSSKARKHLKKAIDIFGGCGAKGWVKKYERELAEP